MTPAVNVAKKAKIDYRIHEYEHDSTSNSYGLEASEKLGVDSKRVFKTLVVDLGGKLAVGIVPVCFTLNMKSIAKALGVKKAEMAKAEDVMRSSGYVLGGVSPLGQKKSLKTVIDSSADEYESVFVSGGKRGLEIELKAQDLKKLTNAIFFPIAN